MDYDNQCVEVGEVRYYSLADKRQSDDVNERRKLVQAELKELRKPSRPLKRALEIEYNV